MADDPHIQQMAMIHQELMDEMREADLVYTRAQRYGAVEEARNASYRMLDAKQRLRELDATYKEYTTPAPQAPAPTPEQEQAKPWDQCDWRDTWNWASKSKYGEPDPEGFRRGIEEVRKRPSKG